MKCNGIQFLRPDPLLPKGITFQRHDPDGARNDPEVAFNF